MLDPLTASFDLLSWDYCGLGRSAPVTHPYTMADVAADAAGLLEIAGWESCRVIGVSFGGMVAQEFAVANPGRVERLALACTSAGGDGGSSYPLQKLLDLPREQRVAAELKLADSRWDRRWLEAHPADRAIAQRLTAVGQDQQDPAAAAARAAQLEAREGHDVWDRLGAITCPALVGYGKYDGIAPARNGTNITSRIRRRRAARHEAATASCSKTRPPSRHSSHSFKHHRADRRARAAGRAPPGRAPAPGPEHRRTQPPGHRAPLRTRNALARDRGHRFLLPRGRPGSLTSRSYWRAMAIRISLSVSVMRSPDRSTVTVCRVPVNGDGAW